MLLYQPFLLIERLLIQYMKIMKISSSSYELITDKRNYTISYNSRLGFQVYMNNINLKSESKLNSLEESLKFIKEFESKF